MNHRQKVGTNLIARLAHLNPAPKPPAPETLSAQAKQLLEQVLREPVRTAEPKHRRQSVRPYAAVGLAALALAGGGLAAGVWDVDDIPLPGRGGQEFSASVEEVVAEKYIRERPPTYTELPPRPAVAFPAGTTYWEAVGQLYAARHGGEKIPAGVRVVDPLPDGKVVRLEDDGAITLDPAAPAGYDVRTGLVIAGFSGPPHGAARALPECQVLLPGKANPPCGDPASTVLVREGAGGGWGVVGPEQAIPTRIIGTTSLAILERAATEADRFSTGPLWDVTSPGRMDADTESARLALERDGRRYYVVPAPNDVICLVVRSTDGSGGAATCNARSVLVTFGAIPLGFDTGSGLVYAGVVGDGYDTVSLPSGTSVPIEGNVFAIEVPEGVDAVALSGPAGSHRVSVFR